MKSILYHHLNITNKDFEIEYIQNLQNENFFLLGIEVSDTDLSNCFHINIDPQHEHHNSKLTSIEYVFNYHEDILNIIRNFDKLFISTLKPDVDSIGSISILIMLLKNNFHINGDLVLRLKAIAKSDRHGRHNWDNHNKDYFRFPNYNIYGLPSGLAYMTSDYKITINQKIKNMISYLKTGTFETLETYNKAVYDNLKKSNKSTYVKTIVPKKLVFISSVHRGAVAYGYKFASTVIAKNENFAFGSGSTKLYGKKVTIAQYEDNKFINLTELKNKLNKLEPGWGGSSVILGSPQTNPTKLKDSTIIDLTKKYLY